METENVIGDKLNALAQLPARSLLIYEVATHSQKFGLFSRYRNILGKARNLLCAMACNSLLSDSHLLTSCFILSS